MKFSKQYILKKVMKMIGSFALFLGTIVIVPTSILGSYQPKCPNELLK